MINENGLLNIFPTAEASGSIVSFENGADGIPMESLSVAVEPTQDLHGYSSPWPAGGGKNKLPPLAGLQNYKSLNSGWTWNDNVATINGITLEVIQKDGIPTGEYKITGTATANTNFYLQRADATPYAGMIMNGIPAGTVGRWEMYCALQVSPYTSWGYDTGNGVTLNSSASGMSLFVLRLKNNGHFDDVFTPMIRLATEADATFAPYSNICPITGRTGLSVYRTGVNVWDEEWELGGVSNQNGTLWTATDRIRSKNYIPCLPNTAYYIKCPSTISTIAFYDRSHSFISALANSAGNVIFTAPASALYMKFGVAGAYGPTYNNDISINYPSTDTNYHAYQGQTIAVDWTSEAGTVYGGTLDVVTGVLTSTHKLIHLDGSTNKAEGVYGNGTIYTNIITGMYNDVSASRQNETLVKSDTLKGTSSTSIANTPYGVSQNTGQRLVLNLPNISTTADANAWLVANETRVLIELATPLTYQLTPQEVATLLGLNNVWSNAGDISLVYHTPADATPSSIDGLFINGEGLQADGWFLKWRKLAAPKPKTDYVSVWGRDGDIDLTESETDGQVFYENRELTMDMVYVGEDWTDAYSELLDMLHGKECAVQFSNDPYWYWAGRIIASLYEHKPHSLTMSGIMFPYKLSVAKVTRSATVSGAIESNGVDVVLPSSRMRVSPKVTVVAGTGESVTLKWGTKTQTLSAGTYYVRGLKVGSDDVTIKVWGTGTVIFEYRKGML